MENTRDQPGPSLHTVWASLTVSNSSHQKKPEASVLRKPAKALGIYYQRLKSPPKSQRANQWRGSCSPTERGPEPVQVGGDPAGRGGAPLPRFPLPGDSRPSPWQAVGSFRLSTDREPACREAHEDLRMKQLDKTSTEVCRGQKSAFWTER